MQRVGPGGAFQRQIPPQIGIPGNGVSHGAGGRECIGGNGLLRVEAKAALEGLLQRGEVSVGLVSELGAHARHKGGRQGLAHRESTSQSGFMIGSKEKNRGRSASGRASLRRARPAIMPTGQPSARAASSTRA